MIAAIAAMLVICCCMSTREGRAEWSARYARLNWYIGPPTLVMLGIIIYQVWQVQQG